jgi:hypothetical protein
MKQIPHLTYAEQFALDEWLSDYPSDLTFADILHEMTSGDAGEDIVVWAAMRDHPLSHVAEFIENTRLHFDRVVGSAFHE